MTRRSDDAFHRLTALFDEVVDLPPDAREERIREATQGKPELEAELRALLAADAAHDGPGLISGVVAQAAQSFLDPQVEGRMLGPWRVLEHLAEGGMGSVYLAERADGAYQARAAIKLVRGGIPSPELSRRFRTERQILADLDHPGVARLLDGGSTDDGTPFLVMEYVDGQPITEWCAERGATLEERLHLFLKVCDAVAYAHTRLVVHRDLKPANILVTPDGQPKLLDFGVARLVDALEESGDGGGPQRTQNLPLMTPAYASPEQLSGERAGLASDVYTLGVILYELLAGRLPLETEGLSSGQVVRLVTQDVPPAPSAAVEDGARRRSLKGDLDVIVSTALRKEPDRRYSSVEALSRDVRSHLEQRPIDARADDWTYRTGRALKRNAGAAAATGLLVALILAFAITSWQQARSLARERDQVLRERTTAQEVSRFLEELFLEADPAQAAGREVTAREVLDRGVERIETELVDQPQVRAALQTVMGRVYRNLGEFQAASPLMDSAVALRLADPSTEPLALFESRHERAELAYALGRYDEAEAIHRQNIALLDSTIDARGPSEELDANLAISLGSLGSALSALGKSDEALELARRVFEVDRRLYEPPHETLALDMIVLADELRGRGEYDEAVQLGREALSQMRQVHGNLHVDVGYALNHLASTLNRAGRAQEALDYALEGLEVRRQVFPGAHPEIASSLGNLANIYGSLEDFEAAEAVRRESLAILTEGFGRDHPYVAGTTHSLGDLLFRAGKTDEAMEVLEEAVALHRTTLPEGHPNLGYPLTSLGRVLLAQDRPEAAEPLLREAYRVRREGLSDGHWFVAASGLELGRALHLMARYDEAETLLEESYETLRATFGPGDSRTGQARDALIRHYRDRGLPERAQALEAAVEG